MTAIKVDADAKTGNTTLSGTTPRGVAISMTMPTEEFLYAAVQILHWKMRDEIERVRNGHESQVDERAGDERGKCGHLRALRGDEVSPEAQPAAVRGQGRDGDTIRAPVPHGDEGEARVRFLPVEDDAEREAWIAEKFHRYTDSTEQECTSNFGADEVCNFMRDAWVAARRPR